MLSALLLSSILHRSARLSFWPQSSISQFVLPKFNIWVLYCPRIDRQRSVYSGGRHCLRSHFSSDTTFDYARATVYMATPTPEQEAQWPAPNYTDPVTRVSIVLGLTVSTMILMVIFIAARFYGRGQLKSILGLDDWIMLGASVWTSIFQTGLILMTIRAICDRGINTGLRLCRFRSWISHMGSKRPLVSYIL